MTARVLVLAALLLAAPSLAAAAPEVAPAPSLAGHLEAAETVYDAGTVNRGTKVTHSFVLRNTGDAELRIDARPG